MKLTVGIPTYNRAPFLREAIMSVVNQIKPEMKSIVEIVISDNASTDNTEDVVKEFIQNYKELKIVYSKNDKNMGFDFNVNRLFELASGEYVALLSDDDVYVEGLLEYILEVTKQQNFGVVMLPSICFDRNMTVYMGDDPHHFPKNIYGKNYKNGYEYIRETRNFYTGFMTSYVVSKKLWKSCLKEEYFGTGYISLNIPADILEENPLHIANKDFVKCRLQNVRSDYSSDVKLSYELITNIEYQGAILRKKKYLKELYSGIYLNHLNKNTRRAILFVKGKGIAPKINILLESTWKNYDKTYLSFWLFDLPVAVLPCFVFKPFYWIYYNFFKTKT